MSFTLTPVYSNTLTGANQNPLDPTDLSADTYTPYQVLNNVGEGTTVSDYANARYIGSPSLSNDQYCSITVHNWTSAVDNELYLYVRSTVDASTAYAAYMYDNDDGTMILQVDVDVNNVAVRTLYQDLVAPIPTLGDSFTLIATGTTIAFFRNSTALFTEVDTSIASGDAIISTGTFSGTLTDITVTDMVFGNAALAYTISGNAGVAGATVSWTGTASGSVVADGSGDYTTDALADGSYTITPSLTNYTFAPTDSAQVVSGADITGVDFVATPSGGIVGWSPEDCRDYATFPNTGVVQPDGSVFYTGQTPSNPAVPGTDSRTDVPVDSRVSIPVNSRVDPTTV